MIHTCDTILLSKFFFLCFSDCINNPAAFFCINEISEFIVQNAHEIQHANHIDSPGY